VNRGGQTFVNPAADFVLQSGDDAVVVAESLGTLAPLQMGDARTAATAVAAAPA
jgi:voltage-gated potassium channel